MTNLLIENISDENLMVEAREGNLDNVAELFERHNAKLYNFFLRLTYNRDLSHDLVQNVFMRIIKYRGSYNEKYNFRTWMYQMARNVLADHYNKEKLKFSEYDDLGKLPDFTDGQEADEEKQQRHKALYDALAKLPDEQREILVLNRFQGVKYSEIAEINGMTLSAVKVKAHRAVNKLRELFFETVL